MDCTCLEVHGEDPDCPLHGVRSVIERLRNDDDLSARMEAADLLEWFAEERDFRLGRQEAEHG